MSDEEKLRDKLESAIAGQNTGDIVDAQAAIDEFYYNKELSSLRARLAEAERERDLAIAHDRQPYPTAEAYELVCAAMHKTKAERDALLVQKEEAISVLQKMDRFMNENARLTKERDSLAAQLAATVKERDAALDKLKVAETALEKIRKAANSSWNSWFAEVAWAALATIRKATP